MFVDIVNPKSPLAVENILAPYKKGRVIKGVRQPKEKITRDVCFEILKSTNYHRNIKDMLLCIAELPKTEQAQFIDVVLSTFYKREQPHSVLTLGCHFADAHGLILPQRKDDEHPTYLSSAPERILTIERNTGHLETEYFDGYDRLICWSDSTIRLGRVLHAEKILPPIIEAPNSEFINFFGKEACDGSRLRKIVVKEGGTVAMDDVNPLPKRVDLTACKRVIIGFYDLKYTKEWKYRPNALTCSEHDLDLAEENLDFSAFGRVVLERCFLGQDAKIVFRKDAEVHFCGIEPKLPDEVDFSECSQVELDMEDLSYLKNLHFKKGAKVTLKRVKNLPPNLDFSSCSEVNLIECDLCNQPNLRFKNGAKIKLEKSYNLPPNLDFSECDDVNLSSCDLASLSNLRFKKGAKVVLARAENLPPNLDFSECAEVNLSYCDLSEQSHLRFMKGAEAVLSNVTLLPKNLDVSPCAEVNFNGSDLAGVTSLSLGEGAVVHMLSTRNLPKNVDFSNCAKVEMQSCDLTEQTQLRFRDGAKVHLIDVKNLKNGADFSNCAELEIVNCNMQELRWLGFRQGANVRLKSISNLPECVDFSPCDDVSIELCDFEKLSAVYFGKGAKVYLERVDNMPAFVDMSECEKIDIYDILKEGFKDTKTLLLRNKAQINQYFDVDGKDNKLLFTEQMNEEQLKEFKAKRNFALQQLKLRSDELKGELAKVSEEITSTSEKTSTSIWKRWWGKFER